MKLSLVENHLLPPQLTIIVRPFSQKSCVASCGKTMEALPAAGGNVDAEGRVGNGAPPHPSQTIHPGAIETGSCMAANLANPTVRGTR